MGTYRDIILDHYKYPRNFGMLEQPDAKASEYNASCGDRLVMEVKEKEKMIKDIRFSGEGCAISIASASMLTEKVKNMKLGDVMKLETNDILTMLGTTLMPSRVKCATLPLEVLQKAVVSLTP